MKKLIPILLALILALACATSALAFSDDYSVTKTEAVGVLSYEKIAIIGGFPDGSFQPGGDLTRAQAVKMLYVLWNGGEDDEAASFSTAAFTDCNGHWANGYIAWGVSEGLVAGLGDGRFAPNAKVTAAQLGKMVLCLLGYDEAAEVYTGPGWSANVVKAAKANGLFDGLARVNVNLALTRENAAQLIFNGLTADMVDYEGGGATIVIPGATVTTGGKTKKIDHARADDYRLAPSGGAADQRDEIKQLCEEYLSELKLVQDARYDAFQRPSRLWQWKAGGTKEVGVFPQAPELSYLDKVELGQVYMDLGLDATAAYQNYYNGDLYQDNTGNSWWALEKDSKYEVGWPGTSLEIYDMGLDNGVQTYRFIWIDEFFGQITDINDSDKDDLQLTIDFGWYNLKARESEGFDFATYSEDQYVLARLADGDFSQAPAPSVQSVAPINSFMGKMTAFKTRDETNAYLDTISVDGQLYNTANTFVNLDEHLFRAKEDDKKTGWYILNPDFDSEFSFFTNSHGQIIGAQLYDEVADYNYFYVKECESKLKGISGDAYAKLAVDFMDGSSAVVNMDVKDANKQKSYYYLNQYVELGGDISGVVTEGWYRYVRTAGGDYRLYTVADVSQGASIGSNDIAIQGAGSALNYATVAAKITYYTGKTLMATGKTTLVLVDSKTTYTGYSNFCDVADIKKLDNSKVLYILTQRGGDALAAIYFHGEDGVNVEHVIARLDSLAAHDANGDKYLFQAKGREYEFYVNHNPAGPAPTEGAIYVLNVDEEYVDLNNVTDVLWDKGKNLKYELIKGQVVDEVTADWFKVEYANPAYVNEATTPGVVKTLTTMVYFEHEKEDINAGVYDVDNGGKEAKLSKNDKVDVVFVTLDSEKYAIHIFITD